MNSLRTIDAYDFGDGYIYLQIPVPMPMGPTKSVGAFGLCKASGPPARIILHDQDERPVGVVGAVNLTGWSNHEQACTLLRHYGGDFADGAEDAVAAEKASREKAKTKGSKASSAGTSIRRKGSRRRGK